MSAASKPIAMRVAKAIAALFGLFAIVYVGWFLLAIYVLYPNEWNTSPLGIVMAILMMLLGVSTFAMSRSVWLRSSGHRTSSRQLWVYTPFTLILSVLMVAASITALIFGILAFILLFMNLALGRSSTQSLAQSKSSSGASTELLGSSHFNRHPELDLP